MLNLQICTVIIMTKKHKKNHAIPEIQTRDTWIQIPPRYPLRYGGHCNFQKKKSIYSKVINRIVGRMCNPHSRKSNALGKHM